MKASGKLGGVVSLGVVFDRISKQLAFRTKVEHVVCVVFQFGRHSKSSTCFVKRSKPHQKFFRQLFTGSGVSAC